MPTPTTQCIECYAIPILLFLMSYISTPLLRALCYVPYVLPLLQKYASHALPADLQLKTGSSSETAAGNSTTSTVGSVDAATGKAKSS